jgi:hypothetical protein
MYLDKLQRQETQLISDGFYLGVISFYHGKATV